MKNALDDFEDHWNPGKAFDDVKYRELLECINFGGDPYLYTASINSWKTMADYWKNQGR